ncbi:23S rRNA (guanosine(2251)-2'-O)-methyltransferase RlmB [Compostibacter hankyongensis]
MQKRKPALIIGRQPVMEALRSGQLIERIFLQRNAGGPAVQELLQLADEQQVPVNRVPAEKLNSMSGAYRRPGTVNHQGCIAIGGLVRYLDLQDVISHVVEQGKVPLFLLLDAITDVRNIGAIARSAVCCGAQALILPDKGVAPLNEEAVKSSAGAFAKIAVCRVDSLLKAVDLLHLNGISVAASEMKADAPLHKCDLRMPVAVIMGSEDKGVHPSLLKATDIVFKIPMAGDFESFNVSVAAGIILYEAMKQRME